jgi:hypothetical protein
LDWTCLLEQARAYNFMHDISSNAYKINFVSSFSLS